MTKSPIMTDKEINEENQLLKIGIYPMTKVEYESFVGYDVEFVEISPKLQLRGVFYKKGSFYVSPIFEDSKKVDNVMLNKGIEAVLCKAISSGDLISEDDSQYKVFWGMPVRKKNSENEN